MALDLRSKKPLTFFKRAIYFLRGVCVPDVLPPDSVLPDCEMARPLLRRCEHAWRDPFIGDAIRCPKSLFFVFEDDKLSTVAMVSTLDIMRAISR